MNSSRRESRPGVIHVNTPSVSAAVGEISRARTERTGEICRFLARLPRRKRPHPRTQRSRSLHIVIANSFLRFAKTSLKKFNS